MSQSSELVGEVERKPTLLSSDKAFGIRFQAENQGDLSSWALTEWVALRPLTIIVSKQWNKCEKRKRRKAYLKRRRERAVATETKPAKK